MTNETTSSGPTGATASGATASGATASGATASGAVASDLAQADTTSAESQPTVLFFSSAFCDPCATARNTLDQVSKLVSHVRYAELDVARHSDEAERAGIVSTPTIVIVAANGDEAFRAQGAPTVNQMLVALAKVV